MQALVDAALKQVLRDVEAIDNPSTAQDKERKIAKAIHTVDALKSALKAQ